MASVLVVVRDRTTAEGIGAALARSGLHLTPLVARSVGEAILALRRDDIAAAIVDVGLSDSSAVMVAAHVRRVLGPAVPLVTLSQELTDGVRAALVDCRVTAHITYPIDAAELTSVLRAALTDDIARAPLRR